MDINSSLLSPDDTLFRDRDDDLYLERLETLYQKQVSDLQAFSVRENRSLEEVSLARQKTAFVMARWRVGQACDLPVALPRTS